MPLVEFYRFERIHKARRRPEWQEETPKTPEGREAYSIAASHEAGFSRAFLASVREVLTPDVRRKFEEAFRTGSVAAMIEAIPIYNEGATSDLPVWTKFVASVSRVYRKVVDDAGTDATERMNRRFRIDSEFTLDDGSTDGVELVLVKAEPEVETVAGVGVGAAVPVNPYSVKWIQERALELVKQGIGDEQRKVIQDIIATGFEEGLRAEAVYRQIQDNIGLTDRDYRAVERRRALHTEADLSPAQVDKLTNKYRSVLLRKRAMMIARTETMKAQAHGRSAAWQMAKDAGELPEVKRVWLTAPPGPRPGRPCPICYNLDGTEAPLGEPYQSINGPIMSAPAHPGCRCTEKLVRGKAKTVEGPIVAKPVPRPRLPVTRPRRRPTARGVPVGVRPKPTRPPRRLVLSMPRTGRKIRLNARQQRFDQAARFIGTDEKRYKAAPRVERREALMWNWVHGSNRKLSVVMKTAAKKTFRLKGLLRNPKGVKISGAMVDAAAADVRAIYRQTQKELRAKGIKTIKLYRGIKTEYSAPGVLESWTTDPKIAKEFGRKVMVQEVPVDRVLSLRGSENWADGIFGDQHEVIVLT